MSTELTTPIKIEIPGIGTIESADLYLKSEADKVIADLEESHKMEVEQLLMEIVELKADYKEACDRLQTANLIKDEQLAATRHSNRKRCVAMAKLAIKDDYASWNMKWHKRWLKLAEHYKEAK